MEHVEYFKNLEEIEKQWSKLRKADFPQKLRDDFWRLCHKGQALFWEMALKDKQKHV